MLKRGLKLAAVLAAAVMICGEAAAEADGTCPNLEVPMQASDRVPTPAPMPAPPLKIRGTTPVEIGIFTPVQIPWARDHAVRGLRLGIGWLSNPEVSGLDLGLVNHAGLLRGVEIGVINAAGTFKGAQFGLYNGSGWNLEGTAPSTGGQIGLVNEADNKAAGFQTGLVNLGERVSGLQLGFLNSVKEASCGWTLQIGFLNFNDDGYWPIMPLVGWSSGKAAPGCGMASCQCGACGCASASDCEASACCAPAATAAE